MSSVDANQSISSTSGLSRTSWIAFIIDVHAHCLVKDVEVKVCVLQSCSPGILAYIPHRYPFIHLGGGEQCL